MMPLKKEIFLVFTILFCFSKCIDDKWKRFGDIMPNLAKYKPASQSTTEFGANAGRAVDDDTSPEFSESSCTHTDGSDKNPWWAVDLQKDYYLHHVIISNRRQYGQKLSTFKFGTTNNDPATKKPTANNINLCGNYKGVEWTYKFDAKFPYLVQNCHTFRCNTHGRWFVVFLEERSPLTLCEVKVFGYEKDECDSHRCENGGKCVNGTSNSHICQCKNGYEGAQCHKEINECGSNPCENSGTCTDHFLGYSCKCPYGFDGINCQSDVDECQTDVCKFNSKCENTFGSFKCDCAPGYLGSLCDTEFDECASNPCPRIDWLGVNGKCVDIVDGYKCICPVGWSGSLCQYEINVCQSRPCQNQGRCVDATNYFTCECEVGFNGPLCEEINACASAPCMTNGSCVARVNGYYCECTEEDSGQNCASTSVALNKPTYQSSLFDDNVSGRAVDGNKNTDLKLGNSCTHTKHNLKAWWTVDLENIYDISSVEITNRGDCCNERLKYFLIGTSLVNPQERAPSAETMKECAKQIQPLGSGETRKIKCSSSGRYVIIQLLGTDFLTLCEVAVYGSRGTGRAIAGALGQEGGGLDSSTLPDLVVGIVVCILVVIGLVAIVKYFTGKSKEKKPDKGLTDGTPTTPRKAKSRKGETNV